ncbi:hypothetical protein FRC16_011473 [Serendipita sp. 398]|nr:hypothetical protein FRC16_011473 [Serendipita sp. 398]
MRVKDLVSRLPVPSHVIKHAYLRITLTRFTTAYFIVALIHAILLSGFQLGSHLSNRTADATLSQLMRAAEIKGNLIPVISNDGGQDVLRLCNGIPSSTDDDRCETIFVPTPTSSSISVSPSGTASATSILSRFNAVATPEIQEAQADSVTGPSGITASDTAIPVVSATTSISTIDSSTSLSVQPTSSVEFAIAEVPLATTESPVGSTNPVNTSSVFSIDPSSSVQPTDSTTVVTVLPPLITGEFSRSTTTRTIGTSSSSEASPTEEVPTVITTTTFQNFIRTSVSTSAPATLETSASSSPSSSETSATETPVTSTETVLTGDGAVTASTTPRELPSVVIAVFSTEVASVSLEPLESLSVASTSLFVPTLATDSAPGTERTAIPLVSQETQTERLLRPGIERRILRRAMEVAPVTNSTTGAIAGLNVTDLSSNGTLAVTFVELRCAQALSIAQEQLHQLRSEDLVMIGYYIWLFGLETVARQKTDIPGFALNALAIVLLGTIGFKLLSVYKRQTTKLVGDSKIIKHLYRASLIFSIIVQIGSFLLLASVALWVQQLFESPIASFSSTTPAFKGVGILSVLLGTPWFLIGWVAIRREHKSLMVVFLVTNAFFLASWTAVFSSDIYRIVFTKWAFFAALTVATFFLLVGSLVTGVLCRMHFGQGLAVQLEEHTRDEVDTASWDFSGGVEKAWEPFERLSVRQSQFTSSDRQSSAFSYGLRSPAPPMPPTRMFGSMSSMTA